MGFRWLDLSLTTIGVFGFLWTARYLRYRGFRPVVRLWPLFLSYNGFWALMFVAERYVEAFTLPAFLAPVALVGGNGFLVSLFGLPTLSLSRMKPGTRGPKAPPPDPHRYKIEPKSRKKRQRKKR